MMTAANSMTLTLGVTAAVDQGDRSLKRLKRNGGEFVCVSFRDWTCYQSRDLN
jgi:hypothetical protein